MRKNHQEIKEEIFRRSDEYFKKRAATRKKLLYTSVPVCICLVVAALIAIPNLPMFKNHSENDKNINKEISYTESTTVEPTEKMEVAEDRYGAGTVDGNVSAGNLTPYSMSDMPTDENKKVTTQPTKKQVSGNKSVAGGSSSSSRNNLTDDTEPSSSTVVTNVPGVSSKEENSTQPTTTPPEDGYHYYITDYESAQDFFNEITCIEVSSGDLDVEVYKKNNKELVKEICQCLGGLLCIDTEAEQDIIDNSDVDIIITIDKNDRQRFLIYYRNYAIRDLADDSAEYGVLTDKSIKNLNYMINKILLK